MNKVIGLILGAGIALLSVAAHAVPITYNISHTIGTYGSVIGTIETDGTLGTLNKSNILDWDLYLNADADLLTISRLTGPSSGNNSSINIYNGSGLVAVNDGSLNSLVFNFNAGPMYIFQILNADSSMVWQMQAGVPFNDEMVRESGPTWNPVQEYQFRGAVTELLGAERVASVPDPASPGLLLIGMAAMFFCPRMRSHAAQL